MTKRQILATVLALLTTFTVGAATPGKGVGCWRGRSPKAALHHRSLPSGRYRGGPLHASSFTGEKRGLVILCEFTDMQFQPEHDRQKYNDMLNQPGYTTSEGFRGSVADYFRDQSDGLFELAFDVVGPYTTLHNYAYYGANDDDGDDLRPQDMVVEMCQAADAEVNFADYDWDGDGEVDEVFVLYAGKGEADSDIKNAIWPHMWTLDEAETELSLDGMKINVYACASELKGSGRIDGIGTFCHEFSHCMGFPDFYDTVNSKKYGMGSFDLMDQGCYNGGGFCPPGYTAYEKMVCGWQMPIVLADEDVTVDSLQPINKGGQTYIIYNDAWPDEYYMIENRQPIGWDKSYPARGLLILHVDYDENLWEWNIPNSVITDQKAQEKYGYRYGNDHERMTFFHANNRDLSAKLYPYLDNDSLTATSMPAAALFNTNAQDTKTMPGALVDIRQNSDSTISFRYRAATVADAIAPVVASPRGGLERVAYDLQGRRVAPPLRRGIYIVGGRLVVVK